MKSALSRAAVRQEQKAAGPPRTTREGLQEWARAHMRGRRLVVVSNREPYSHVREDGGIRVVRNAGGLVVALDAVAQALGGVWVAHGQGSADRDVVDAGDRVPCPPERPSYVLRRVWLSDEDHERYYSGFSNGALWPLCHIAYVRPRFRREDWERYRDVNRRFAEAAVAEAGDGPALVFLQDYHLALAPKFIRELRPDIQIAHFWHIPWPNPEVFRILPWRHEVLEGLLANDVLAFHIRAHAINFLDTVAETLEARVMRERFAVERGDRRTWVRNLAISINSDEIAEMVERPEVIEAERALRAELGLQPGDRVLLGVDRLDYTKGIPERLGAYERLLETRPEWRGRTCFVQIGVPSRVELPEYRAVMEQTREAAGRINAAYARAQGPAVHLIEANLDFRDLLPWYRTADLCAVTSLHDGMNLVAKEYLAACTDLEGALVLSPFTGAARELERAYIASPYDRDGLAEAYNAALAEPAGPRAERMSALRETVFRANIFDWARAMLDMVESLTLRTPAADALEVPE
ncbi:MAG TPA: trehalose-6-phosphate synthase [Candidatus Eisenbacteria bacterium]|nr:trehalose-6-phosphate synthase [Candidatus Eisenbacteria bacterium]